METSVRSSGFIFDCVHLLYYKFHERNTSRGGSYKGSPDWIKNKKAIVNPIHKKDKKCFQYVLGVALNYKRIKKNLQKITRIKSFIEKYNREGIYYPSKKDDWEKIEKDNLTIALNILYTKKRKNYVSLMF